MTTFSTLPLSSWTHLSHDDLDIFERDSLIVAPNDELEEVVSQHLEDHTDVGAVDTANFEVVQELNTSFTESVRFVAFANLEQGQCPGDLFLAWAQQSRVTYAFEQFYFIQRRLRVVRGTFNHFEGHKLLVSAKGTEAVSPARRRWSRALHPSGAMTICWYANRRTREADPEETSRFGAGHIDRYQRQSLKSLVILQSYKVHTSHVQSTCQNRMSAVYLVLLTGVWLLFPPEGIVS